MRTAWAPSLAFGLALENINVLLEALLVKFDARGQRRESVGLHGVLRVRWQALMHSPRLSRLRTARRVSYIYCSAPAQSREGV